MRFWAAYLCLIVVVSPLVQFYAMDGLMRANYLGSAVPLLLLCALFIGALLLLLSRYCPYAMWVRWVAGVVGAIALAVPPAFVYLGALGRAFKN